MSETRVDLVRRGYDAAMRGDFQLISRLLDPDVSWHGGDPTDDGSCHNRREALAFMRDARARGRIGELVDVVELGDRVVVITRPPDAAGALAANLTTFRDGKVVEMVHFDDPADALAAARA